MMLSVLSLLLPGIAGQSSFDPHWLRSLAPAAQVSQSRLLISSGDTSVAQAADVVLIEGLLKLGDMASVLKESGQFEGRYPGSPLVHRVRLLKAWAELGQDDQADAVEDLADLVQSTDRIVAGEARLSLRNLVKAGKLEFASAARLSAALGPNDSLQSELRSTTRFDQPPVFLLLPQSGEFGELGRRLVQGAMLELKRANQPWVVLEESPDPARTWKLLSAAVGLARPKAIIGPMMSASAVVCAAGLATLAPEIPLILPTATSPGIAGLDPHAWQLNFTTAAQGEAMARYAWNCLDVREAAMIFPQGDYGEGVAEGFRKAFTARGGRVFWQQSYPPGRTDFRTQMESLKRTWQQGRNKDNAAPVVFAPVETSKEIQTIASQVSGLNPVWLGSSGWHSQNFLKESAAKFDGSLLVTDYAPDDRRPEWKTFSQNYKQAYKEIPDRLAALGYDAASLALAADGIASNTPYAGAQGEIRFDGPNRHNTAVPLLKVSRKAFLVQSGDCTRKP
jgi:branched-chain amino acid transport system substrate-binding protein